jgi:2,3,4,5-tetrahydropyridine-2-carboxylate N-succinyltransferase
MPQNWDEHKKLISEAFETRSNGIDPSIIEYVHQVIRALDEGELRVAEVNGDQVVVNDWVKQAILLLFVTEQITATELEPFEFADKIPLKHDYIQAGVRVVPGASARWGSFIGRGVVMMPSYVNIGAYVGAETMVDTWATVGSCAQIGERVHLSGGVGIGGVLEPPQAAPVVIGNDAFIGSRAMIVEGARVGDGAVVGAGLILSPSIPVIDAETGQEVSRGIIPSWCVAVNASRSREFTGGTFGLPCALIIKRLSQGERHNKAALNDLLRTHGSAV